MEVEIVKFDNLGRGIGYLNDKIIFVPKSVPQDIVKVKITKSKKNYLEGEIIDIIKPSKMRIKAKCPLFNNCGGCDLMHINISEELEYKLRKINELLSNNKIDYLVKDIVKSPSHYNYRNKVSLKIVDQKIGFYKNNTHDLIEIPYCFLCKEEINAIIKDLPLLKINNGNIVIRCNYNDEILLDIQTKDEICNIAELIDKHKIVGILNNGKLIYGNDYFIEKIANYLFKVSYNSFFQVNPFICAKLFELVSNNTEESQHILDLYCGVGSLGIVASHHDKKVLGVEIVENAIKNALVNKNLNNVINGDFICSDTIDVINKITNDYDTIIYDPPRGGVPKQILERSISQKIKKIIYISCNPQTLIRDLNILNVNYKIKEFILLDMFPNTNHIESFCVLNYQE